MVWGGNGHGHEIVGFAVAEKIGVALMMRLLSSSSAKRKRKEEYNRRSVRTVPRPKKAKRITALKKAGRRESGSRR